ncbi:hypothetical protein NDU88_004538 [Pleurodeles waltl]|uniref:Uncharacterized protein n=1 Tax=Pleurodeles waltl TaxID=8319 RepID=A0AAV7WA16_PLEWA|nr:hypothetical protein NDU88_004538 [Pleurodeles waltl]
MRGWHYEDEETAGHLLASQLHQQEAALAIPAIQDPTGNIITCPQNIADEFANFYQKLYTPETVEDPEHCTAFLTDLRSLMAQAKLSRKWREKLSKEREKLHAEVDCAWEKTRAFRVRAGDGCPCCACWELRVSEEQVVALGAQHWVSWVRSCFSACDCVIVSSPGDATVVHYWEGPCGADTGAWGRKKVMAAARHRKVSAAREPRLSLEERLGRRGAPSSSHSSLALWPPLLPALRFLLCSSEECLTAGAAAHLPHRRVPAILA